MELIFWNIFVFLLYGFDKLQSKIKGWRISEVMLLTSTIFFGGIGALLGMTIFRHKTRKIRFWVVSVLSTLITVLLLIYLFLGGFWGFSIIYKI